MCLCIFDIYTDLQAGIEANVSPLTRDMLRQFLGHIGFLIGFYGVEFTEMLSQWLLYNHFQALS